MRFGKRASIESKTGIFHSTLSQIGKQASVDWTVGKLLNIVLLVLVLVLVIYGISTQSLNPLIDNIGGKFDEVKIMLHLKDDIASRDCHEENVANLGGGKDFLKAIDMEGKDVILNVCKNRICNISGAGVTPYRVSGEKFEKLEGGKWVDYNSLLTEGIGDAEFNWDLYNAGVGALSGAKDLYNKGFTKKFVLYGDGSGANREVYAIWQNGYWRVSEREQMPDGTGWVRRGDKEWERINDMGKAGSTKTVVTSLYSGTDDNLAINAFVERVKGGDDDKVYWAVLESDEIYNKDVNKNINSRLIPQGKFNIMHSITLLDYQIEGAVWIFYGEVIKIDGNLYMARIDKDKRLEINIGGSESSTQNWQHVRDNRGCHTRIEKNGGSWGRDCDYKNLDKEFFIEDERVSIYNIDEYFNNLNKGVIGTLVGNIGMGSDFDELDDKDEVIKLKEKFVELRNKYLSEAKLSVEEFNEKIVDKKIVGEKIEVDGKTFEIGIEEGREFPIITLSSNGKIFGLRHSVYANVNSDFLKGVKLRDFPVVLVEKVGSEWKEIGNEEYYRLPEKNFNEVYRATLISEFLKSRCK